jgi:myo-inositol 2-dehydrogenase / D-chiro-inositol 1-dehydrogenase
VRIGLIGCGRAAERGHMPALRRLPDVRVVALADTDQTRLDGLADEYGVESRYGDHRELLADPAVQAVGVCVPAGLHVDVALASLEAGKHALVEKPLALSLAECDRLIEGASGSAARTTIGFNMRWHRLVQRTRQAVDAGTLGRVRLLRTVYGSGSRLEPGLPAWRGRRDLGGGALIEQAVHHFDLWRFLLRSEVEEVFAAAQGADETATVTARMRNGVLVESAFCQFTGHSNEIDLYGENGRLRVCCYRVDGFELLPSGSAPGSARARLSGLARVVRKAPQGLRALRSGGTFQDSYRAQWRHFIDAVEDDLPFQVTLDDGRRALEVALAAGQSASSGAAVKCEEAR